MIITQDGYDPGDDPAGVPLIGYDNKIFDVIADSSADGYPDDNLLNPSMHLIWRAGEAGPATLTLYVNGTVDYIALARHNFTHISLRRSASLDAISDFLLLLLHFDGTEASPNIFDSSGHDVGIGGGLVLRTAQFKFGPSSVQFSGGNIFLGGSPTLNIGSQSFTVDFWVRHDALGLNETYIDTGSELTGFRLYKNTSNFLVFRAGSTDRITGATALTATTWHHVAVTRGGTSTRVFLNGVQQGSTYTDSNVYTPQNFATIGKTNASTNGVGGYLDEFRVLVGRAAWTGAFTPPTTAYDGTIDILSGAQYQALFHFDGVDASTTVTDSDGGHVFTAQNGAQIDTAQFKFGTASMLFDGVNDYISGDGSSDFAMANGDFTVDFWVRFNALGSPVLFDTGPNFSGPVAYIEIFVSATKIRFWTAGAERITGTTVITTGSWYHVALTRKDGSTRLFLNGVQEGSTYVDANDYQNGTVQHPLIGVEGDLGAGTYFNGWIDELRIIKGFALWSTPFAVPLRAAGDEALLGRTGPVEDFSPLMFRVSPTDDYLGLEVQAAGDDPPELGVAYAGELLVLERSVKVDVGHVNLFHARQSNVLAGMSESGNFLGRVLTSEWRESQAEFAWFTPDWYRTYFEPFAESAMTDPFFWVWNPDEYPDEVTFAWITENIRPETDPATRRVAATIVMRAIV